MQDQMYPSDDNRKVMIKNSNVFKVIQVLQIHLRKLNLEKHHSDITVMLVSGIILITLQGGDKEGTVTEN